MPPIPAAICRPARLPRNTNRPANSRRGRRLRMMVSSVAPGGPWPVIWTSCCWRRGEPSLSCKATGIWTCTGSRPSACRPRRRPHRWSPSGPCGLHVVEELGIGQRRRTPSHGRTKQEQQGEKDAHEDQPVPPPGWRRRRGTLGSLPVVWTRLRRTGLVVHAVTPRRGFRTRPHDRNPRVSVTFSSFAAHRLRRSARYLQAERIPVLDRPCASRRTARRSSRVTPIFSSSRRNASAPRSR